VATFAGIMNSQPSVFQSTALGQLGAATQTVSAALQVYQSAANLSSSFSGSAQQVQSGQSQTTIGKAVQVLSTLNSVQSTVRSSATQMQALKTRLTAIVTAARGIGFIVTPAGQVLLAGWMYNPYTVAGYKALAAAFQAQITMVVMQATAVDIQKGIAFAKVAIDLVSAIANWDSTSPAPATAPGIIDPGDPGPVAPALPTLPDGRADDDATGVSGGLAGAGVLAGAGGLGGASAPGGAATGIAFGGPGVGGPMGAGMVAAQTPGLAGGGGGVIGAPVAASATARGAAPGPFLGMGGIPAAAGNAHERDRVATAWMLTEDQDLFAVGGLPTADGGVLS
jgi:hypothetical protein